MVNWADERELFFVCLVANLGHASVPVALATVAGIVYGEKVSFGRSDSAMS